MLILGLAKSTVVKIFTHDALVANSKYRGHVAPTAFGSLVFHELLARSLYFLDLSNLDNFRTHSRRSLDLSDRDFGLFGE